MCAVLYTKNQKSLEPKGVESENVAPVATFLLQMVALDVVKSLIGNFSISVLNYDRPKEDKPVFAGHVQPFYLPDLVHWSVHSVTLNKVLQEWGLQSQKQQY